jgi:hypothetical protein
MCLTLAAKADQPSTIVRQGRRCMPIFRLAIGPGGYGLFAIGLSLDTLGAVGASRILRTSSRFSARMSSM